MKLDPKERIFKVLSGNRIVSHFKQRDTGRSPYCAWEIHLSEDIHVEWPKLTLYEAKKAAELLGLALCKIKVKVQDVEVEIEQ